MAKSTFEPTSGAVGMVAPADTVNACNAVYLACPIDNDNLTVSTTKCNPPALHGKHGAVQ